MGEKGVNDRKISPPFVRGGVFEGLDDYKKSRPISVEAKILEYTFGGKQSEEDIPINYEHGMRVRLGDFFEDLSKGIYGGEKKPSEVLSKANGDPLLSEPDLCHPKDALYREIKSFRNGSGLKLLDKQMEKYAQIQFPDLQAQLNFKELLKDPKIRFELFRHRIRDLTKNYGDSRINELVRDLSENIGFMASVPFSVIYSIYDDPDGRSGFTKRYEGKCEDWYTSFRSRGLNNLLAHPEETLEAFGFNVDDFRIHRRKFPRSIIMDGNFIHPFPVLVVTESRPKLQLKRLKERVEERRRRMEEKFPGYNARFGRVERPRTRTKEITYSEDPFELMDPVERGSKGEFDDSELPVDKVDLDDEIPF